MANRMAADAPKPVNGETFEQRLTRVVSFLNQKGYIAKWEKADSDGYYLHTSNCPYHDVSQNHSQVCLMDMTLISDLLGTVPERMSWLAAGEYSCSYHIPAPATPATASANQTNLFWSCHLYPAYIATMIIVWAGRSPMMTRPK